MHTKEHDPKDSVAIFLALVPKEAYEISSDGMSFIMTNLYGQKWSFSKSFGQYRFIIYQILSQ